MSKKSTLSSRADENFESMFVDDNNNNNNSNKLYSIDPVWLNDAIGCRTCQNT
jgi:hypothetical protein